MGNRLETSSSRPASFMDSFLESRRSFQPQAFGVDATRDEFGERVLSFFQDIYPNGWTPEELLFYPSEALHFCGMLRRTHGWYHVPDDIILRVILERATIPAG